MMTGSDQPIAEATMAGATYDAAEQMRGRPISFMAHLEAENARLKQTVARLMNETSELRRVLNDWQESGHEKRDSRVLSASLQYRKAAATLQTGSLGGRDIDGPVARRRR